MAPSTFRGLPTSFWRLWLATLVNKLGGFVVPFLALFLGSERQVSAATTGLVVACFGVGGMLAGPVGGALADRVGRKRTVVAGMGLSAVAMMALTQPSSPLGLAVTCFFLGAAMELPRPATSALVADLVPEADRPRAYGALYWAANLGFACAALLAGVASSLSFFALFVVDALTCLACAAIVALGVPEVRQTAERGSRASAASDLTRPFRDPAFLRFFAASVTVALVFFQFHVAMPLDMRAHGVTTSEYGVLVALNGVLVVALQPFAPRVTGRMSHGAALALGAVLNGAGFGLLALVDGVFGYAVAIATFTAGEVLMAPVNPTVVAALAPPSLRATYQGAFLLSYSLAAAVSPLLGGALLSSLGGPVLWGGCFALGLVGAALHLSATGSRQRAVAPVAA